MTIDDLPRIVKDVFNISIEDGERRFDLKTAEIEIIPRESLDRTWYQIKAHFKKPWGYRNGQEWVHRDEITLFPPLFVGDPPDNWFNLHDIIKSFYHDWKYNYSQFWARHEGKPTMVEPPKIYSADSDHENVVMVEVLDLNTEWSEDMLDWGHDAVLGCWVNSNLLPTIYDDRIIGKMLSMEPALFVGTQIRWNDETVWDNNKRLILLGENAVEM